MIRKSSISIFTLVLSMTLFTQSFYAQHPPQDQSQHHEQKDKFFTLKGKIIDWEGNPIRKAVVLIPQISKSKETDESGHFEISQIPPGRYHVEVYAEGYMDYSTDPFNLIENKTNYQIILIKKISEEIVVTATRTPKIYAETAVKTQIISSREIETKSAVNFAESLSFITGVRVETRCQSCNYSQVRINGMEGKYTQILIDSSPVMSAMTSVYSLEQIPAEMIDRIEVVKGGGSVLYGGNAVAGVINILTKEPKENRTNLKVHLESIQEEPLTNFGIHSSFVSKDLNRKVYLYANYKKREPVDLNEDSFSEMGTLSNTSIGLNFYNYFYGVKGKLKLGVFRIFEERRGGDLFEKPPHEANIAEWIKTDQVGFFSEWNQSFTENLHWNLSFCIIDAKRNTYYGSYKDPNAYGWTKNPILFFNTQLNRQIGSHVLSFGVQYKRDKIRDEAIGYGRFIRETYHEGGLYIQDDFKISKTFTFLTGIRLNKHSELDKIIVTPRASLLFNITKDLSFRTSISSGFRAPQVFDEDLHIEQVGGRQMFIINSPDLKEEQSYSIYSGFDYGKQIGENLIQFSLEAFYTRLNDTFILHELDLKKQARILERINGSGSHVSGLSVEFGLTLGPVLSLAGGWTFLQNRLEKPEPNFNSIYFFRTPRSYGHTQINYENRKLISANLSFEYTGSMKVPHYAGYIKEDRLESTSSFWVVNTKLYRLITLTQGFNMRIFIGAFNLFNSYQKDLDKGIGRDSGYVYGPSKPRSLYAGFEFSF